MPSLRTGIEKLAVLEPNLNAKRQRSSSPTMPAPLKLPTLPVPVKDFLPHFSKAKDTPVAELIEPYKAYEAELRKFYAQQPNDPVLKDGLINTVSIYAGQDSSLKVRARKLDAETAAEKEKYVMSLDDADRKPDGSPAVVTSLKEFQTNFNLFSESSLSELDWSNVVAAGSSVTTALLPVPKKWAKSKKSLREYYHELLAPASDVDLFIYGLTEEEGLAKIKHIEEKVKDSILHEVTTIRTKNAITIASQYPTRHVQIVLRLYDSISQIITGFDVDCACVAYDGKEVYGSPRALAAFSTQTNTIDLTRRSPSYENRLSKYSHRGFEVHWPDLDRSRIDPTIFERAFRRTLGLARLLVLEKLPKTLDRERYTDKRREERGRPAVNRYVRDQHKLSGNIKDDQEDEVAEWVEEDQISNYHTMVVPYGKRFNAHKIERLLYTKDLLLNSEWNRPKDREVDLHRHPCFFGTAEDVLGDCCGFCPIPITDEEIEIAEEESKTYISGSLTFVKEDPGRQEIGSFNPITTDDWTEMAYVGNTQMLCQAIVDGDLDYITSWCEQEGNDVNTRDYVGRTPLHLAVMNGKADVVKILVDNGARLVARLLDGRCALHMAAQVGNTEIVKILMEKSIANEEEEANKADKLKAAKLAAKKSKDGDEEMADADADDDGSEDSGMEVETEDDSDDDSETQGFTKVKEQPAPGESNDIPEDDGEEPDFYDINVVAWDLQCTALHFAIMGGHIPMIRLLVGEYGADVLLPIKIGMQNRSNRAILSLVLAMSSPPEKSKSLIDTLLEHGASSAQADMDHYTAMHYAVDQNNVDSLDTFFERDGPAARSVINLVSIGTYNSAKTLLSLALTKGRVEIIPKLLSLGAKPSIEFDDYLKAFLAKVEYARAWSAEQNQRTFQTSCSQPLILASVQEFPKMAMELLARGADPSTLTVAGHTAINGNYHYNSRAGTTILDVVRQKVEVLRQYNMGELTPKAEPATLKSEAYYLEGLKPGTYKYWTALNRYKQVKSENDAHWSTYKKYDNTEPDFESAVEAKMSAVQSLISEYEELERTLISLGAKSFKEAYPQIQTQSLNGGIHNALKVDTPTVSPYETYFTFNLPNLNDHHKEGYFRLFEAVWRNDIDEVKALTLSSWKSEDGEENPALKIAIQDTVSLSSGGYGYPYYSKFAAINRKPFVGMSPLSLAVLRGPSHYKMAKVIVEIALAQYEPLEHTSGKSKWRIEFDEDAYSDDSDSEGSGEGSSIHLRSELVDDVFTIDNVAAISTLIKSHVKPMDMVNWQCNAPWFLDDKNRPEGDLCSNQSTLMQYAVDADDIGLLKFLYHIAEEQAAHFSDETISPATSLTKNGFYQAINLGRTAILAEMIKRTGVGIPLDQLVEKSGLTIQEKPQYYQGLNVGGKKNAKWANAGNPNGGNYNHRAAETTPPLLEAARSGNLESVQWFLSKLPTTKYLEYAAANQNDKRVQVLSDSEQGFEHTISKWLNMRYDILLHCAVLYVPTEAKAPEHMTMVKYIATSDISLLEKRSLGGFTPLHLACTRRSAEVISYLLSIGANVRSRDATGRNIVHHLISPPDNGKVLDKIDDFGTLLSLFKRSDVAEMLLERDILGFTPLAFWQTQGHSHNVNQTPNAAIIPEIVSSYTSGRELTIMNSVGDLPLHVAIKLGRPLHVRNFLAQNPQTLGRENATGITALELALGKLQSASIDHLKGGIATSWQDARNEEMSRMGIETKSWREFLPKKGKEGREERLLGNEMEPLERHQWVWEECLAVKQQLEKSGEGLKRRLVSLGEANEVARRMVVAHKWRTPEHNWQNNGEIVGEGEWDEVVVMMRQREAQGWVMHGRAVVKVNMD